MDSRAALALDSACTQRQRRTQDIPLAISPWLKSVVGKYINESDDHMRKLSSVRNTEIVTLRQRCEGLVARICLAEGNAQRLGIDPTEL